MRRVNRERTRRAGILAPVPSLRRDGDLGIGDTGALRELVDWAAEYEVGFLQLLPINETGNDHSPYNAISSVAMEPALIDLREVPELHESDLDGARAALPELVLVAPELLPAPQPTGNARSRFFHSLRRERIELLQRLRKQRVR